MDIIQTSLKAGSTDAEVNILDASDQFVYQPDADQVMVLRNPTGSAISPVLTGNNVSSAHPVPGAMPMDLTGGFAVGAIAAGQSVAIPLDSVRFWIKGSISFINNGAGLQCVIYTRDNLPNIPDLLWIDGGKLVAAGFLTVNSKLWS